MLPGRQKIACGAAFSIEFPLLSMGIQRIFIQNNYEICCNSLQFNLPTIHQKSMLLGLSPALQKFKAFSFRQVDENTLNFCSLVREI